MFLLCYNCKRLSDDPLFNLNMIICEIYISVSYTHLERLKVDKMGLDNTDHELLLAVIEKFGGVHALPGGDVFGVVSAAVSRLDVARLLDQPRHHSASC